MAAVDRQRVEQERIALQDQLDEVCCHLQYLYKVNFKA
jgi:hypothetical protein